MRLGVIGGEFSAAICRPLKVFAGTASNTGNREFEVDYHANYPAGVQQKRYRLRTIERGKRYLLARSLEDTPARFLQIYAITPDWIRAHFPGMQPDARNFAEWLERHC